MVYTIDPPVSHYIYYNGFTFPQLAKYTVQTAPLPGDNAFSRKGTGVTVHIEFILTANDPIPGGPYGDAGSTTNANGTLDEVDAVSSALKTLLETPNRPFALINTGFGRVVLNGAPTVGGSTYSRTHYPLTPGPQVTVSTYRPAGYNFLAGFVVDIYFEIRESLTVRSQVGPALQPKDSFAYAYTDFFLERGWDIDDMSRTTRSTNGNFKLLRPIENGTINHGLQLDVLLGTVVPSLTGYHRKQSYNVRGDGLTVDFSVIDTEIPTLDAYPKGAHDLSSITYSVESSSNLLGMGNSIWMHTLSGTIKTSAFAPRSTAWEIMLWAIRGRLSATIGRGSTAQAIVFKHFKVEESPFDWTAGLTFTYTWQASYSLTDLLKNSGIFVAYDAGNSEANWSAWKEFSDRTQQKSASGGMAISDNILEVRPVSGVSQQQVLPKVRDKVRFPPEVPAYTGPDQRQILNPPVPPAQASYDTYVIKVSLITEDHTAIVYQGPPRNPQSRQDFRVETNPTQVGTLYPANQGGAPSAKVYNSGPSVVIVEVEIVASRYGAPPQIAKLKSIGNQPALTLMNPQLKRTSLPVSPGVVQHLLYSKTQYTVENEVTQDLLSSLVFTFTSDQVARR